MVIWNFQIWHRNWCPEHRIWSDLIKIVILETPSEGSKRDEIKDFAFFRSLPGSWDQPVKKGVFQTPLVALGGPPKWSFWSFLIKNRENHKKVISRPPLGEVQKRVKKRFRFFSFFAGFLGPTRQKRCFSNSSYSLKPLRFDQIWSKMIKSWSKVIKTDRVLHH